MLKENETPFQVINGVQSMISRPDDMESELFDLDVPAGEIERFPVGDGYVVVVEQSRGEIGYAAIGRDAWEKLNALVSIHRFSSLEIYEVLGGKRESAPERLLSDHFFFYLGNSGTQKPRQLPSIDEITGTPHPTFFFGQSAIGLISPSGCVKGSVEVFKYFGYWFYDYSAMFNPPGVGSLGDLGANGIHAIGQWDQGDANLNLGPTSAGSAVACFCQELYATNDALLTVQEFIGNGVWIDIWSGRSGYPGSAFGIWFKGIQIHRIRLLIRDNEDNVGDPFFWGGAF
jgi:hypothetical protein